MKKILYFFALCLFVVHASFTYAQSAPTVTSISPTTARVGDRVTITGTGFLANDQVSVAGVNIVSVPQNLVTTVNDTKIEFTVPSTTYPSSFYPLRIHTVKIRRPGIVSSNSKEITIVANASAPTITSIVPSQAKIGDIVTITGTGFTTANPTTLEGFASNNLSDFGFGTTVTSPTRLTFQIPAESYGAPVATGTYQVVINNSGVNISEAKPFTILSSNTNPVPAPALETLTGSNTATPSSIQTARINNFVAGSTLAFTNTGGAVEERPLTQQSGTIYTFPVPNAAGSYTNIRVKTPSGVYSNALANPPMGAYVVVPVVVVPPPSPVITSITPTTGSSSTVITFRATNISPNIEGIGVLVYTANGALSVPNIGVSGLVLSVDTVFSIQLPNLAPGTYFFKVGTTVGGTTLISATSTQSFTVTAPTTPPPVTVPTITSITPTSGTHRDSIIQFIGTNFGTSPRVYLYDTQTNQEYGWFGSPTPNLILNPTNTSFQLNLGTVSIGGPVPLPASIYKFRVVNAIGTSALTTQSFTVTGPAVILPPVVIPTITSFTPTSGLSGTQIRFTGTGFRNQVLVDIYKTSGQYAGATMGSNMTSTGFDILVPELPSGTYVFQGLTLDSNNAPIRTATSTQFFTVNGAIAPPTNFSVTSITPSVRAGQAVTVRGTGFGSPTTHSVQVYFPRSNIAPFRPVSSTEFSFIMPKDVIPSSLLGMQESLKFEIRGTDNIIEGTSIPVVIQVLAASDAPIVGSVSPATLPLGGTVTVTGSGFTQSSTIRIIKNPANIIHSPTPIITTFISSGELRGEIPNPIDLGVYGVAVFNFYPGIGNVSSEGKSIQLVAGAPVLPLTITGITPATGGTSTTIRITGSGFDAPGIDVLPFKVNDINVGGAYGPTALGKTFLEFIPHSLTSGVYFFRLRSIQNGVPVYSATSTQSFTVTGPILPPPTVQNLETLTGSTTATPNSIQTARINNFVAGSTLSFTNITNTTIEVPLTQQSGTIYTFPAPNAVGSYTNIRVKTPAGVYSNALANPPMGAYVVVPVVVVPPPVVQVPMLTAVTPNPAQWGGTITLTGTNFTSTSDAITNEVVTVRLIENTTDASVTLVTTSLTANRIVAKLPTATSTRTQYRVSVERKIGTATPVISNLLALEIKSGGTVFVPPPPPIPVAATVQSIIKVGGKSFTLIATKSVDEGRIIALRVIAPSNMTRTTSFKLRIVGGTARTPSDYTSFGTATIRFVVGGAKEKKISVRTKINTASQDDKTIKFRLTSIDGRSANERLSPGITSTIVNIE